MGKRTVAAFLGAVLWLAGAWGALAGDEVCSTCHQAEHAAWSLSDHARAMAAASEASVLGDFSGVTVSHHGTSATFRRSGDAFEVAISEGKITETYPLAYTFGHAPLQQYLVETERGKYQVLPFAWDSRPVVEGGQRWFPNYPAENVVPGDRLHWKAPLQNWNGMCADCHSTGLTRRYDPSADRFDTQYASVNVSCSSCHAGAARHAEARLKGGGVDDGWKDELMAYLRQDGGFVRADGEATAHWTGKAPRARPEIEVCASCHSLRAPLTDGIDPGEKYLDQFLPSLLDDPLYFPDGQIRDEVYVWGSFLQSRMYAAGVSCLDCHDSHSMKLKVQGNGLCTQCHASEVFDTPDHHHHTPDAVGSQCVDCHMSARTYMVVDPRRDHSFKVPRPDMALRTGSPDPCTSCHLDRKPAWAAEVIARWFPERKPRDSYAVTIHQARQGDPAAREGLVRLIGDDRQPEIVRATALSLVPRVVDPALARLAAGVLVSDKPLMRIGAIRGLAMLPVADRQPYVAPLLDDPLRAVRVEAARSLLDAPGIDLTGRAFVELMAADEGSSWRGEGRVNLARHYLVRHDYDAMEAEYRQAIRIDPGFAPARINLAEFLHQTGRQDESHALLMAAAEATGPVDPEIHHALGLSFVRQGDLATALEHLKIATEAAPRNARYAYVYLVALNSSGAAVFGQLKDAIAAHPYDENLLRFGLSVAMKTGDRDYARDVTDRLQAINPAGAQRP